MAARSIFGAQANDIDTLIKPVDVTYLRPEMQRMSVGTLPLAATAGTAGFHGSGLCVILLWSTWCQPQHVIRSVLTGFNECYKTYRSVGVQFVAISNEEPDEVAQFVYSGVPFKDEEETAEENQAFELMLRTLTLRERKTIEDAKEQRKIAIEELRRNPCPLAVDTTQQVHFNLLTKTHTLSLPHVFLLQQDGSVVWHGHPSEKNTAPGSMGGKEDNMLNHVLTESLIRSGIPSSKLGAIFQTNQ
jgi:hypothetical protein